MTDLSLHLHPDVIDALRDNEWSDSEIEQWLTDHNKAVRRLAPPLEPTDTEVEALASELWTHSDDDRPWDDVAEMWLDLARVSLRAVRMKDAPNAPNAAIARGASMSTNDFTAAATEHAREEVLVQDPDHQPSERPLTSFERSLFVEGALWAHNHLGAPNTSNGEHS